MDVILRAAPSGSAASRLATRLIPRGAPPRPVASGPYGDRRWRLPGRSGVDHVDILDSDPDLGPASTPTLPLVLGELKHHVLA